MNNKKSEQDIKKEIQEDIKKQEKNIYHESVEKSGLMSPYSDYTPETTRNT